MPRATKADVPAAERARRFPIRNEEALKNLALRYVARFPCTTEKLKKHLAKKMREAVQAEEAQPRDTRPWIDGVVATLTRVRLLDDKAFAESRALTLHRRGRATSIIVRDLARLGSGEDAIVHARAALAGSAEHPDLSAAARLAKRKKLGPFAPRPLTRELRQRHLATLARGGFGFDLARSIVDASDTATIEALIRG